MLLAVLAIATTHAQVTFEFSDGLYDASLKAKAERNISTFLTNVNKAAQAGATTVDLSGVMMTDQARESFNDLWDFFPFKCMDDVNVQSCIHSVTGYSVREIPVLVTDNDTKEAPSPRELTICFNKSGEINSVNFALEQHNISTILQSGRSVNDVEKRQEILNFVERYRSYYDEKDIASIEAIFTDDAIIITGKVGMVKTKEMGMVRTVEYEKQTKLQYIDKLKGIFRSKKYVKVKFTGIEVIPHPNRDDIYLVRLLQNWRTPGYEDNGYVTLLWQFPDDGGDPRIMLRTWQNEGVVKTGEAKLFNLRDFKIY